jgi:hypothetical protein
MHSALGSLIYKERRRLGFVVFTAFLAGVLFYLQSPVFVGGIHISLITGAIYALVVGVAALVVCIVFPAMRFMIEAIAISRLMLSLFVVCVPHLGFQILANPLLTALLVVSGGILVSRVLHGRILRDGPRWRTPWDDRWRERVPARVQGTPAQHRRVGWFDDHMPIAA